jgi:hypothetical protein
MGQQTRRETGFLGENEAKAISYGQEFNIFLVYQDLTAGPCLAAGASAPGLRAANSQSGYPHHVGLRARGNAAVDVQDVSFSSSWRNNDSSWPSHKRAPVFDDPR